MQNKNRAILIASTLCLTIAGGIVLAQTDDAKQTNKQSEAKSAEPTQQQVERVRREVRMLDDIYKGGIVAITQHYVTDEDAIPAGTAFKSLFVTAEKKGWHRVRLVDATGDPISDENSAEDDFEKRAIKQLLAGKAWVEEIENREGTQHLRVATPIPVVFEKCIMCHDNFANLPKGRAIGALTYTVPIEGKLMTKLAKQERMKAK